MGGQRARAALLAVLLAALAAPSAHAAAPSIVNSPTSHWAESFTSEDDGNRGVAVTFVVRHDTGRRITGIVRDTDFDGTDETGTLGATAITGEYLGAPGTNRLASTVVQHVFTPPEPGGYSCPLFGGGTRRVDVPLRFRVVDDLGQRSTAVAYTWRVVEDDQCTGSDDFPTLESVGQSATSAATGQNVTFNFTCDDADSTGSNDRCDRIYWRTRRLNDNVVSGLTQHDAEDNTARSFAVSFATRGVYVVEAILCGEDDSGTSCQNGTFWRLGSVTVNESTLPSGSIAFSGAGVVGSSVNQGDAATAVATVNGGGGTNGAAQAIEWDAAGDGVFERIEFTAPTLSGGAVVQGNVAGGQLQQAVDTSTHGLKSVRARVYDNGAIDAADSDRRVSSTIAADLRVNARPVAEDASAETDEDTAVDVELPASDADGQPSPLSYEILDAPEHGTVSLSGATATYTPAANYSGPDSFSFRAQDGPVDGAAWSHSNVATVSLTVNAVNDPPVADDQSVATDEDTPVEITLTGSDVEGGPLTFAPAGDGPAHGSLACDGATCTYTPAANFNGSDSFDFTATDPDGASDTGRVDVEVRAVNDAPDAQDAALATDEDTALELTLPASDVDGETLTATVTDAPDHGTLDCAGLDCTYTPAGNFHGADAFAYAVEDPSGASDAGTVSIDVASVNDAPAAADVAAFTTQDVPVQVALSASDVEDAELSYAVADGPANGDVECDGALCTYTPDQFFHGTDTFTYRATDTGGASDEATVTIAVEDVLHETALAAEPVVRLIEGPAQVKLRFEARLTRADTGDALAGRTISFVVGGEPACTAETGADGVATCEWQLPQHVSVVLAQGYDAVFAGDEDHTASASHGPLLR